MGMIRVSDDAEKKIKEMANGRTVTATVDALLAGGGRNFDKEYFDNKFREQQEALREIKSLIEDTTVDRLDKRKGGQKIPLSWDLIRELFYDVLEYDAPEWWGKEVVSAVKDSPDGVEGHEFFAEDKLIVSPFPGGRIVWAKISPRIKNYLADHGVMV